MLKRNEISSIYTKYGFEEKGSSIDGVIVFAIKSGYFHNADIVILDENVDADKVFEQFQSSGYACTIRRYESIDEVSLSLFSGFFSVTSTRKRHEREYIAFTSSLIDKYSETAKYSYIDVDYIKNGVEGESNVVDEILSDINKEKPVLFLIEAAAGFGKTCTSYELLKHLIEKETLKVPLFSELSRNRQAKIFKYVLLDEIDRSFPQLSSSLVTAEIRNGNVPVILDGFDELLHRSQESEGYDNTEPMLETIGELLQGNAKVILTTRRTAIFDGDGFHEWMNAHDDDFDIVRIRLKEPLVENWLPRNRLEILESSGFPVFKLKNPVLLSYLRCIDDEEFKEAASKPDLLVDRYFDALLDRERLRQDLRMLPIDQYKVMKTIADDMIDLNYTAESRDYILSVITERNEALLESTRKNYPREEKPSIDELANKLASHALLDRKQEAEQGVGFVNEFVLGNFCAENILNDDVSEWSGDQRFIEPSVISYAPRSLEKRKALWDALKFRLEFEEPERRVASAIDLTDELSIDLIGESISEINLKNTVIGRKGKLDNTVFIDSVFKDVTLFVSNINEVTFVNCGFYGCELGSDVENNNIYFVNCLSDNGFIELFIVPEELEEKVDSAHECEVYVLAKFWPIGRESFHKHRPIKALCSNTKKYSSREILSAISRLKHKSILKVPDKVSFVELNIDVISDIKKMLGR